MLRFSLFSFLFISFFGISQKQQILLKLNKVPSNNNGDFIVIKEFYGDNFNLIYRQEIPNDSIAQLEIKFQKSSSVGLFQIFIEDPKEQEPNIAEFILNPEEFPTIEANYFQLKNGSISIVNSVENQAYNDLMSLKDYYGPQLLELRNKRLSLSHFDPSFKQNCTNLELQMELLQAKFDQELLQIKDLYPKSFAARVLLPLSLIPIRSSELEWANKYDSYLSFLHANYFYFVDYSNPENLRHYAFCDNLFYYLNEFSIKNETGAKKGIDQIMSCLKDNEEVNSFIYNYLLSTFLKLENEALTMHVLQNHSSSCSLNLSFEELKKLNSIQALNVGGTIPEISLPNAQGIYQSLRSFSKKNEYTVLFFWLSWCKRCQKEIPELVSIYKRNKSSNIGFYTVSLDEKRADWDSKLALLDKNWMNVAELVPMKNSTALKTFQISTTPVIYVIDKNGVVIAKNVYGQELENLLRNLSKNENGK